MTVGGGWTSHVTKGDGDYNALKAAALAQAGENQFMQGIQYAFADPTAPIKGSRSAYGDTNLKVGQVLSPGNFQQSDDPGAMPLNDPRTSTGRVDLQASATKTPQQDPEVFETAALENRLRSGAMNNLNNINSLYS